MARSETYSADIEPDPHNDQMAARAQEELDWHLGSTRNAMTQGGRVEVMTLIASAFIDNPDSYPRERLASILAAALMRLAGEPEYDERAVAIAERDLAWGIVEAARSAEKRLRAALIACAPYLDQPFTNAPHTSPWDRSIRPAMTRLREALHPNTPVVDTTEDQ